MLSMPLTGIVSFALKPGDINGDKAVDVKDVVRLMKILAGFDIENDPLMNDTNGDTRVDSKDLIRLMKYLAGSDVELFPKENTAVYYVRPGEEGGTGTVADPFGSLAEAQSAIEGDCESGVVPEGYGIDLVLFGGDYYQDSTLVISSERLGGRALRYIAASGENARIVGGKVLDSSKFGAADEYAVSTVKDKAAAEAILTYDLSAEGCDYTSSGFAVYEDGKRAVEARYPNTDVGFIVGFREVALVDQLYTFSDPDGVVGTWKSPVGVKVEGRFQVDWSQDQGVIERYEDGVVYMSTATAPSGTGTYYFSNVLDELDVPGEYYVDRETGKLYIYPTDTSANTRIVVPTCEGSLVSILGDGITLEGITVEVGLGDGITVQGDGNSVKNCVIRCFRGIGIDGHGDDTYIYNNELCELGKGGVNLAGGDGKTMRYSGNTIDNNSVHDYAQVDTVYNAGISADGYGCEVTHNEIFNAPHNAINYTAAGMIMEYNYIHDVCRAGNDAGAIYDGGWGSTAVFRNNIVKDIVNVYKVQNPNDEDDYRPLGYPNGYYSDDGGSEKTVDSNIFINIGGNALGFGGGRDNTLTNNIIIRGGIYYDERVYYAIKNQANAGWATGQTQFPSGPLWRDLIRQEGFGTEEWALSFPLTSIIGASNVVDYDSRYIGKSFGGANLRQNIIYPSTVQLQLQPNTKRLVDVRDNYYVDYLDYIGFADFDGGDYRIKRDAPIYMALPGFVPCDAANVGRR